MDLTYTIDQVLGPKMQSKHGDRYHVLGTRQLLNRDRYNVLFGMFVSNRYQTDICLEPNREKEALGHHFHSLFPLQKCKIQFIQTEVSV